MIKAFINRIKQSDIGSRMATGLFWSFTGTALAKLIILLSGIICAHILGKEGFGEYGMLKSTLSLFVGLGSMGVGLTATKYISEYWRNDKEHASSIYILSNLFALAIGIVGAILVYIFAENIAVYTLNAPQLTDSIKVSSIILVVLVMNMVQDSSLVGFERFKSKSLNLMVGNFAEAIAMCTGAYFWGVVGAIIGYGVGYSVLLLLNYISTHKKFKSIGHRPRIKDLRRSDIKLLYTYSLPAIISTLLAAPCFWIIKAMLVRYDSGFGNLAIYNVAEQWRVLILFIPSAMCQILLPILSSMGDKNKDKFWKVLNLNIGINASVTIIITIVVTILSGVIMSLYGEGFTNPWPLIIISTSTIFNSVSAVLGVTISSMAKMWTWCFFNVLWAVVAISFSYLFLNMGLGVTGISIAVLISYVEHAVLQYIYIYYLKKSH